MQIPDMCIKSSPIDILSQKNLKLALGRQDSTEFSQIPTIKRKTIIQITQNVGEIQEISPERDDDFACEAILASS